MGACGRGSAGACRRDLATLGIFIDLNEPFEGGVVLWALVGAVLWALAGAIRQLWATLFFLRYFGP